VVHEISVSWSLSKETVYNLTNAIYPITIVVGRTSDLANNSNTGICAITRKEGAGRAEESFRHPHEPPDLRVLAKPRRLGHKSAL
jgi:hypothetical protein